MLIRCEQSDAFQQASMLRFEDRILKHVHDTFSENVSGQGDLLIRARISAAIEAASCYGFSTERNLVFYIDLTFVFGADFASRLLWAKSVLESAAVDEDEKRRRLMNAASDHQRDAVIANLSGTR